MKLQSNDPEGLDLLTSFFQALGYSVIRCSSTCRHDLEITKDGITYWLEVKKRPCLSTAYGDIICQKDKLEHLQSNPHSYLINIFSDGIWMADVNSTPYEEQRTYAQATNNWNTNKVPKTLISFKVKDCKKLDIL